VKEANDILDVFAVDRIAGELVIYNDLDDLLPGKIEIKSDDPRARNHHVTYPV